MTQWRLSRGTPMRARASRHEDWEVDEYVDRQQRARQRERLASGRYEWVEAEDGLPGPILVEKREG